MQTIGVIVETGVLHANAPRKIMQSKAVPVRVPAHEFGYDTFIEGAPPEEAVLHIGQLLLQIAHFRSPCHQAANLVMREVITRS